MNLEEMYDTACAMYDKLMDIQFKGTVLSDGDLILRRKLITTCARIAIDCKLPHDEEPTNG